MTSNEDSGMEEKGHDPVFPEFIMPERVFAGLDPELPELILIPL